MTYVHNSSEHMHKNAVLVPPYVDVSLMDVDLETVDLMRDYEQLSILLAKLQALPNVIDARRVGVG